MEDTKTLKVTYTTATLLGGIVFLASLLSGWLSQTSDLRTVVAEHKMLTAIVGVNSNRLTTLEQAILFNRESLSELKVELKEVRLTQKELLTVILARGKL